MSQPAYTRRFWGSHASSDLSVNGPGFRTDRGSAVQARATFTSSMIPSFNSRPAFSVAGLLRIWLPCCTTRPSFVAAAMIFGPSS